jgi:hypothetical protein
MLAAADGTKFSGVIKWYERYGQRVKSAPLMIQVLSRAIKEM